MKASEKAVAINTNKIHIERKLNADPALAPYRNQEFINKAAKWNFEHFGFGVACPYEYLEFIGKKENTSARGLLKPRQTI